MAVLLMVNNRTVENTMQSRPTTTPVNSARRPLIVQRSSLMMTPFTWQDSGKPKDETRPAGGALLDAEGSVMRVGDLTGDGEAEAGTVVVEPAGVVQPGERWNTRSRSSSAIPGPSSLTASSTTVWAACTSTHTWCVQCLWALSSRLASSRLIWVGTASTVLPGARWSRTGS